MKSGGSRCVRVRAILLILLATALVNSGVRADGTGWWDAGWRFRVPVQFSAGSVDRIRRCAEADINFTSLLATLGAEGRIDTGKIRVVEVDGLGNVVTDTVAFQFDPAPDFDDSANAAGTLIVLMSGTTAASASRTYHVYFDVIGQGGSAAQVSPQVTLTDGIWDEGQECFVITNTSGSIYYQKMGGAFSSWLDNNGNDWVGYNPTYGSEAAGDARGIPNSCYPRGFFHPGASGDAASITTLKHQGPLKTTIHSIQVDGYFECQWEIYPEYARLTMIKTDTAYWILYEGTPGGEMDGTVDFVTRSDGRQTGGDVRWEEDVPGEEWVYFSDPNVNRSLYLYHEEQDDIMDQYYMMTSVAPPLDGKMTVMGFGRHLSQMYLYDTPQHFVYGIVDGTEYAPTAALIRSSGGTLAATVGTPEQLAFTPVTLLAPPDGATYQSRTPQLRWLSFPEATNYRVQIATDSLFSGTSIVVNVLAGDTVYTPSLLSPNTLYCWRVAAVKSSSTLPFGPKWSFQTVGGVPNQAQLAYPENGTVIQKDSVVCGWRTVPGASQYAIEWTTDALFAFPDIDSTLTDTLKAFSLEVGQYYWRVRAKNLAGWGPYSEIRNFTTVLTGVDDDAQTPVATALLPNYPNPFNPTTSIGYTVGVVSRQSLVVSSQWSAAGWVRLAVYDLLGREVAVLVDGQKEPGTYTAVWDASGMPSGVYLVRLQSGTVQETRSMMLLK